MRKEDGRSRRPNHRIEQPAKQISQTLRNRDIHDRQNNVSKTEAIEFMALFFPEEEEVGEYAYHVICERIKSSLSRLATHISTEDDIRLLKMGYQYLPDRWDPIQSYIRHPTEYSEELNDELAYLARCYKIMGTGRR